MGFFNNLRAKKRLEEHPELVTIRRRDAVSFRVPLCDDCAHSDTAHVGGVGGCIRCDCARFSASENLKERESRQDGV